MDVMEVIWVGDRPALRGLVRDFLVFGPARDVAAKPLRGRLVVAAPHVVVGADLRALVPFHWLFFFRTKLSFAG